MIRVVACGFVLGAVGHVVAGCGGGGRGGGGGGGTLPEPRVASVRPGAGLAAGGEDVEVLGIGLTSGALTNTAEFSVRFAGVSAPGVVANPTSGNLACRTPSGALGFADVEVVSTDGARTSRLQDGFYYYGFGSLTTVPASTLTTEPSVAAVGATIHFACVDASPLFVSGNPTLAYVRSGDSAATWSAPARIDQGPGAVTAPSIAALDSMVVVTWLDPRFAATGSQQADVYARASSDAGATWSAERRLTTTPLKRSRPEFVAADGRFVCVWSEQPDPLVDHNVLRCTTTSDGQTWAPAQNLTSFAGSQVQPGLAASGQRVACTWLYDAPGTAGTEVYCSLSLDAGGTFSSTSRVTDPTTTTFQSKSPRVGVSAAVVFCAWAEINEVFFARSTDGGTTWSRPASIQFDRYTTFSAPPVARSPAVLVSGLTVACFWSSAPSGATVTSYFRVSEDGGGTWSPHPSPPQMPSSYGPSPLPQVTTPILAMMSTARSSREVDVVLVASPDMVTTGRFPTR